MLIDILNGMLGFILGFILFIIIVLAILFHKSISNFKKILQQAADARAARKQAEEDAYFKRTSTKNYREDGPKFKDDYFKGTGTGTKEEPKTQSSQQQKPKQETTARQTVDKNSGVTIIDDRGKQQSDRKIFNDSEGEYVDFVEVSE